jgi:thiamine biosynthesis protein ThiS
MCDQPQLDRSTQVSVTVNGTLTSVERGTTVTELLNQMGTLPGRVAVEINLTVIERDVFGRTSLQEGDRVEIVSFVGGGHG